MTTSPPSLDERRVDDAGSPQDDGLSLRDFWTEYVVPLHDLLVPLLGALTAWLSVVSWHGMAENAFFGFLLPLLVLSLLTTGVGWWIRRRGHQAWVALLAQLVVVGLWVLHRSSGSFLPLPGAVGELRDELVAGALAGQRYVSPVSTQHPEFATVLLLGGAGIVVAVDLLGSALRQPALAGLPLLLSITISASVLLTPVSWLIFVVVALGWLSLIAVQEGDRLGSWEARSSGPPIAGLASMAGLAGRIAAVCVTAAVVLTAGITAEGRQLADFGGGTGDGTLATSNPMLDMRRNLRESRNVPLVNVKATREPSYLRLTVLDSFDLDAWRPSNRNVDNTAVVSSSLPPPAGLNPLNQGSSVRWDITVSKSFDTRWLPIPFITSLLDVPGTWRYSPDTLDVLSGSQDSAAGLSYSLTTYQPEVDATALRAGTTTPSVVVRRLTRLPDGLPPTFAQVARQVTAGATNDYDRAVALQDWFRENGGFTYSLTPGSGTGVNTLERFITTDKVGYCEQFSTAMAVMARTLGIPSRVSVGFLRPQKTGSRSWTFGSRSLHAWPELFFSGVGWIRFEPTPADRTGDAPAYTAPQAQATESAAPTASGGATVKPTQAKPQILPQDQTSATSGGGSVPWRLIIAVLVLLLLVALALSPVLLRRRGTRRRWADATSPQALADAAWTEVRATALDLDLEWSDRDTVRSNGERVQKSVTSTLEARDAMAEVVRFVELSRYARPTSLPADAATRLRADVDTWARELHRSVDPRRSRRATWWPRSVWRGRRRR